VVLEVVVVEGKVVLEVVVVEGKVVLVMLVVLVVDCGEERTIAAATPTMMITTITTATSTVEIARVPLFTSSSTFLRRDVVVCV
jgi:hypothetical protein